MKYLMICLIGICYQLSGQVINDFSDTQGLVLPIGDTSQTAYKVKGNVILLNSDSLMYFFNGSVWNHVSDITIKDSNILFGLQAGDSISYWIQ